MRTSWVKRHVAELEMGTIFTTRDVLHYANRGTVDQVLCRLVKKGVIKRLARGVFMKLGWEEVPLPSPAEVAAAKAKAWGKRIIEHGLDCAAKLGLVVAGNEQITYFVDGNSSSFQCLDTRIRFRRANPKKMLLGNTRLATIAKALWFMGEEFSRHNHERVLESIGFDRRDRQEWPGLSRLIPSWLADLIVDIKYFWRIKPLLAPI